MNQERMNAVDFLPGIAQSSMAIMYRLPKSTYIQPMSFVSWFIYVLVTMAIVFVSWIFFEIRRKIGNGSKNKDIAVPDNVVASVLQQSKFA